MPTSRTAQPNTYPLRTVSQLTGLSPDLIRAWEKRYAVVSPERGARGARLYTTDDIAHLRLLARAVKSGRAIGDVAALTREELRELVAAEPPPGAEDPPVAVSGPAAEGAVSRALAAVEQFDLARLNSELGSTLAALGAEAFVRDVCAVLLHEVGERWERGELSIAQEHMLTSALRTMLHAMIQWNRRTRVGHVLLTTPPGETHEAGILMTALLLSEAGVAVTYLGCDVPAAEIVNAAVRCQDVGVVGLGLTGDANQQAAVECVRELDRDLPGGMEIWLGGRAARAIADKTDSVRIYVIDGARALETRIAELAGG